MKSLTLTLTGAAALALLAIAQTPTQAAQRFGCDSFSQQGHCTRSNVDKGRGFYSVYVPPVHITHIPEIGAPPEGPGLGVPGGAGAAGGGGGGR